MESFHNLIATLSGFVWGPYLLLPLLLGAGAYLMIGLRFMPLRYMGMAFRVMWKGRKVEAGHEGELSPFKALMTSMAATRPLPQALGTSCWDATHSSTSASWVRICCC